MLARVVHGSPSLWPAHVATIIDGVVCSSGVRPLQAPPKTGTNHNYTSIQLHTTVFHSSSSLLENNLIYFWSHYVFLKVWRLGEEMKIYVEISSCEHFFHSIRPTLE